MIKMKFIYFLLLIGCTYALAADDDTKTDKAAQTDKNEDVAKEKEDQRNTICDLCICDKKQINCASISLLKMFTTEEWTEFNKSTVIPDIVQFDNNAIQEVTRFPKLDIRILSLKNNAIVKIEAQAFRDLYMLEELDLSGNKLSLATLRPEIFEGKYDATEYEPLKKLKVLKLGKNHLHSLDGDIFEHLPNLESLSLDENPFLVIDHVTTTVISTIGKLKFLDLSYLELTTLPEYIFHTPLGLTTLNLTGNLFKTIPSALSYARNLQYLNMDENPLNDLEGINVFPELKKLETLELSYMSPMARIGKGALSQLTGLRKLKIENNPHLTEIHPLAISRVGTDGINTEEWPIIKELSLYNNNLSVLDHHLLGRWDNLDFIDIRMNPWQCDCENQWVIDTLVPVILAQNNHMSKQMVCDHPSALIGVELATLKEKESKLRCMDKYDHHPEGDGAILIGILVGLLIGIPMSLAILFIYRRGCFGIMGYAGPGPADYSRAFYKRADLHDDLRVHI